MSSRFTLSQHSGSADGDHFDLFLQVEETLKSWRITKTLFETPQVALRTEDHRLDYLSFEGPVSKGRGTVKIFDTGEYTIDRWTDTLIIIAARGRQVRSRLQLTRPGDAKENEWLIVDPATPLKRLATSLLRTSGLEAAPTPQLSDLQAALSAEERALLAMVDAYARGQTVEWNRATTNSAFREQLTSERARWRHPWLEAATAHAGKLDEIARMLQAARP